MLTGGQRAMTVKSSSSVVTVPPLILSVIMGINVSLCDMKRESPKKDVIITHSMEQVQLCAVHR